MVGSRLEERVRSTCMSLVTGRRSLVVGHQSLDLLIIPVLFDEAGEAVLFYGEAIA